jgi:hypothetical protein
MKNIVLLAILDFIFLCPIFPQDLVQILKGTVTDRETGMPLPGANIFILDSSPPLGVVADTNGKFRFATSIGRITIRISFLGYEDMILKDVLITSGREVNITAGLQEKVIQTNEVVVRSSKGNIPNISQMAAVSINTIRPEDALHYAGGFYDPARIVNSFAGVVTANNDDSNDLIIRGNSPRGLLWRLEGVEIPNPNHFSSGMGGSGGAFSAVTSNVIDNFDFFTGAFPAEFGNAFSGIMDLNLRRGNNDVREYAFQTGMIGGEIAAEGPFTKNSEASYLLNARYTNFKILSDLELIDLGEINYAPRTKDVVFNISLPSKKTGNINIFGLYGASALGRIAERDYRKWISTSDRWEEMEKQSSLTVGIKHYYVIPGGETYIKSVLAYSSFSDYYHEGYVDSSYVHTDSYYYDYKYPSFRYSLIVNHKFSARQSVRVGINYNYLSGNMANYKLISEGVFDTLVAPHDNATLLQSHFQWKYRTTAGFEINAGMHILYYSLNGEISIEPRLGLRWQLWPGGTFIAGLGVHSKTESLAAYNSLIKNDEGRPATLNHDMGLANAFHGVAGFDFSFKNDVRLRIETYFESLNNIPIVNLATSRYSTLNTAERLPEQVLENAGTGRNTGIEITLEKSFTKNYYFLITGSLYDSWYTAGDNKRYNTLYNTKYVSNILAGKDFSFGKDKRNLIGINSRLICRGGYRYTPVNKSRSLELNRIVYLDSQTYSKQLPGFLRIDAGISFRRNFSKSSLVVMLDVQNATGRRNVFKRRFSYETGKIIVNDILSIGTVPVFNFRIEF